MKWHEDYRLGIEKIDDQHQMLFHLINKLDESVDSHEDLYRVLNEIVEFVNMHFDLEESLMLTANFSELDEHKKVHNQIKEEVYHACKSLIEKEYTTSDVKKLVVFLEKWLKDHILHMDKKYVTSIKNIKS